MKKAAPEFAVYVLLTDFILFILNLIFLYTKKHVCQYANRYVGRPVSFYLNFNFFSIFLRIFLLFFYLIQIYYHFQKLLFNKIVEIFVVDIHISLLLRPATAKTQFTLNHILTLTHTQIHAQFNALLISKVLISDSCNFSRGIYIYICPKAQM